MYTNRRSHPTAHASGRQLLVVALCAVGLLVAALAMPATAPTPAPPSLDFLNGESDCTITLSETPTPGQPVTATVRYQGEPVRDSRVWFNGQSVGRTDQRGRVTGTVPYEKRLRIQVELPGGGRCRAGPPTGDEVSAPESVDGAASTAGSLGGTHAPMRVADDAPIRPKQAANGSSEYPVRGRIDIAVGRQPYPGETTTIRATIRGHPVPDATVTVDGRQVGRTDDDGKASIIAPERGDGTLRVAVERGEFRSVRRVVVLRLHVDVRSENVLPLPGQEATVDARLGDRPATNASVTVGGRSIGQTDENGTVGIRLPADPTAEVTAATSDQTVSTLAALVYLPTILFALGFVAVTAGIPIAGYVTGGRRGFVAGLLAVGVIYALSIGYLVGGGTGLLAVVALLVLAVGLGSFVRSDHDIASAVSSLAATVRGLGDRVFADTLWLTGRIEATIDGITDRLGTVRERLGSSSLADVRAWLARLPARMLAALRGLVSAPGQLLDRGGEPTEETDAAAAQRSVERARSPTERFREIWRQFASRVVPTEWPRRTAGEVSRRAIERGFPSEPVEELTERFRAVEYGDEPLTERQVEQATAALSAIDEGSDEEGSS